MIMHGLASLFPVDDFTLLPVILLLPLLGALFNGLFGKRLGQQAVSLMGVSSVFLAFLVSAVSFVGLLQQPATGGVARLSWHGWEWLRLSLPQSGGSFAIEVAFSMDALSGVMALLVTGISFLIHLYSTKYMAKDEGYARFFAYLNLFVFAMLVLVLGDNLPVLFVGWEGVGLCSYLLIGFWFSEDKNASAGKKAFITNRIGDFGLLVAMGLLVVYLGGLDWRTVESSAAHRLLEPIQIWPLGNGNVPLSALFSALSLEGAAAFVSEPGYASPATLIGLALFLGCAGKSAQLPLYVWLPDAMAGPTPVSALIHAATMVTAGIYLVCRMAPVFVLSPAAMFTIALIGALTAVFAATIAFVQKDIKRVLAYSTVSQLGYMFLGVGVGAFTAGFFHVLTHAFFKACLFLGAGSVIYAMHKTIHDPDASQDMGYMGGLRRYMPVTFATFAAAWAAIVGLPGTSGFFSKDEILVQAFASHIEAPRSSFVRAGQTVELLGWPSFGSALLGVLAVMGAVMTAFYMTRLLIGIFFGNFRGWTVVAAPPASDAHLAADHHPDAGHHGPVAGPGLEGVAPRESPWQMTLPLVVLGVLSLVGGFLNAHLLHLTPLDHLLEPLFKKLPGVITSPDKVAIEHRVLPFGIGAFVVGVGLAYLVFVHKKGAPAEAFAMRFPKFYRLLREKWRVDELYRSTIIFVLEALAELATWIDVWIVDGILARFSAFVVSASGAVLRLFQTGRVQSYASLMVVGVFGVGFYLTRPHAKLDIVPDPASGKYGVVARAGLGYSYRWDADGDGRFEGERRKDNRRLEVSLARAEKRRVGLEVTGPTGAVVTTELVIERPRLDQSHGVMRLDVFEDADGKTRLAPPTGSQNRVQGLNDILDAIRQQGNEK